MVWLEQEPGNINFHINQITDSYMAVSQSHFLNNKFVVTLGYRKDEVGIDRGPPVDPVIGWVPDFSITPDTPSSQGISPSSPENRV